MPGWTMKAKIPPLLVDIATICAIVALLTLLFHGQIAAAVLVILVLTFLFFANKQNPQ